MERMPNAHLTAKLAGLLLLAMAPGAHAGGDFTAKASGRLYYDFARFDNDARGPGERGGDDLRAAWLAVSGKFLAVDYKFEADFAGHKPVARDAFLTHRVGDTTLTLGQFKQFYTLDDRGSSNHMLTIERSWLVQVLSPGYRLGAGANGYHRGMFWSGSIASLESIDAWKQQGHIVGGRVGFAPQAAPGRSLHFGASLAREKHDHPGINGAPALRLQPRIAGYFADNSRLVLVDFRSGRDVDVQRFGLETAGVVGAWSWQAEYGGGNYDDGQQRGEIRSGYLQGSWLLTGESRPYDARAGRFVQLKPQRSTGAWELVVRHDRISGRQWPLTRRDVSAEEWTLGVNWYAPRYFRLMLDWTDSRRRDELSGLMLDHTGVLSGRAQFDF